MARSRARARVACSAQGQPRGRCKVSLRAERVSRPAIEKKRRRRVLVVPVHSIIERNQDFPIRDNGALGRPRLALGPLSCRRSGGPGRGRGRRRVGAAGRERRRKGQRKDNAQQGYVSCRACTGRFLSLPVLTGTIYPQIHTYRIAESLWVSMLRHPFRPGSPLPNMCWYVGFRGDERAAPYAIANMRWERRQNDMPSVPG